MFKFSLRGTWRLQQPLSNLVPRYFERERLRPECCKTYFYIEHIVVFLEISWSTDQQSRSSSSMQTFKLASVITMP